MSGNKLKLKIKAEGPAVAKTLNKFHIDAKGIKPKKVTIKDGEAKVKKV